MNFKRLLPAIVTCLSLMCLPAHAHVMLEKSSPANNAVLHETPKSVDLSFAHPTRLVMLKLQKGKDAIPVQLDGSSAESKTFTIPIPALAPGQYQLIWSALSADGHPMKGTVAFTLADK